MCDMLFHEKERTQEDRIKINSSMSRLPIHDVLSTTALWCRHICSKRKWHGTFTTIYDFPMHYRGLSASIGKMPLAATLPRYSGDRRILLVSDITYPLRIFVMFKRAFSMFTLHHYISRFLVWQMSYWMKRSVDPVSLRNKPRVFRVYSLVRGKNCKIPSLYSILL